MGCSLCKHSFELSEYYNGRGSELYFSDRAGRLHAGSLAKHHDAREERAFVDGNLIRVIRPGDEVYLVHVEWAAQWRHFVSNALPAPGTIPNHLLTTGSSKMLKLKPSALPMKHFRPVTPAVWMFLFERYGATAIISTLIPTDLCEDECSKIMDSTSSFRWTDYTRAVIPSDSADRALSSSNLLFDGQLQHVESFTNKTNSDIGDEEILHRLSGEFHLEFDTTLETLVDRVVNGGRSPVDHRPFAKAQVTAAAGKGMRRVGSGQESVSRGSDRSSLSDSSAIEVEVKVEPNHESQALLDESLDEGEDPVPVAEASPRRVNGGKNVLPLTRSRLHEMVKRQEHDDLKAALERSISMTVIDACDKNQQTALHLAARLNSAPIVASLLENGANINALDGTNNTPLLLATDLDVIALLCTRGADLSVQNESGLTALHLAVLRKDAVSVLALLDHGSAVNVGAKNTGLTALHYAVKMGEAAIANLLLAQPGSSAADPSLVDFEGNTALHVLASADYFDSTVELVTMLLEHGARPGQANNRGLTALHLAASNLTFEAANVSEIIMKALLAAGASPNLPSDDGCTAAHLAAEHGNWAALAALLEFGADLNLVWRYNLCETTVLQLIPGTRRCEMLRRIKAPQSPIPEARVTACMECSDVFSVFLWKRRCAVCQRVVCSKCVTENVPVTTLPSNIAGSIDTEAVTVCKVCKPR